MKKLIFLFLMLIGWMSGSGQNYVRLADAGGINVSDHLQDLENASTHLVASLADSLQSKFKVFDTGFYLHNENMEGENEIDNLWSTTKDKLNIDYDSISYYILFGRVIYSNGKSEIKVHIKLPDTDVFYCIDNISAGFREEVRNQVYTKANYLLTPSNVFENEITAINALQYIITNKICCDLDGARNAAVCNACMVFPDEIHIDSDGNKIYPTSKEFTRLLQNGFAIDAVLVNVDNEYHIPEDDPSFRGHVESGSRSGTGEINATITLRNDGQTTVSALLDNILLTAVGLEVYEYKYPRDCGQYDAIWNNFNSTSNPAIFIALINVDRKNGFLAYKLKTNGTSNRGGQRNIFGAGDPTEDDLEGMQEALKDADGSCGNLILAYGNKFEYYVDKFISKVVFSKEQEKFYEDYYANKNNRTSNSLNDAAHEYGYYFDMEFHVQKREYNRFDWTAKVVSHYNMCNEVVHGVLDFCGVIEPLGVVCDGANFILYSFKGDKTNATLSAAAIIPVVGTGIKIAGKTAKFASVQVHLTYRFKHLTTGAVHFVGGEGKLLKYMKKVNFTTTFAGITRKAGDALTEAHHLFPSELFAVTGQHPIFIKMAKMGWHAGDPWLNGLVIPKYCKNGTAVFHANHKTGYNEWVRKALTKVDGMTGDDVLIHIAKLESKIKNELEFAWENNISINNHFLNKIANNQFY